MAIELSGRRGSWQQSGLIEERRTGIVKETDVVG